MTIPIIIVGNKIDLVDARDVQKNDAIKYTYKYNYKYFDISTKTGEMLIMQ